MLKKKRLGGNGSSELICLIQFSKVPGLFKISMSVCSQGERSPTQVKGDMIYQR